MSKITKMDDYLALYNNEITSAEVCEVVRKVFEIDLEEKHTLNKIVIEEDNISSSLAEKSIARKAIDDFIKQSNDEITGDNIRKMINEIFGVNLNAISTLEDGRISLYSKNQWISKSEKDLFVVYTSNNDADAKVYPTIYFKEKSSEEELPTILQESLIELGYIYNKELGTCYFSNSTGEAVPDEFKGKTMAAICKVIQEAYSNI